MLVDFCNVTALAFVLTSIGLEHEGHEVLALALIVNLAVGDDIPGELSDSVRDGTLGFDGLEGEGRDPGEQPQNEHGRERGMFAAHLILRPPAVGNLERIGCVADSIKVVAERDAADDVHGGAGGVLDNVEFEGALARGMDLVGNARLEGGGDVIDVGVHRAHVVRRKGGRDETAHALVLLLALDPDERAAAEADDKRAENGRVGIVVGVLRVDVAETNGIAHNQLARTL